MGTLADIVNVQIALNTAAVQRGNFGTPLIASPLASFSELVRIYSNYDDAQSDGLPQILLTALSDAFAQTPHPRQIKVGRLSVASVAFAPTDATGLAVYGLKVGTTVISVTAVASPTLTTIASQLALAITAAAIPGVTAAAVGGVVTITYSGDVVPLTSFVKVQWDLIVPSATTGIMAADLAAIRDQDNAWYTLHLTERTKARVLSAAEWIETQEKIFITASSEAAILDPASTIDIISMLKSAQYFRTAIAYQSNANTEFPDVAWASRVLTIQPGAETWALKRLASVTPDNLSGTQKNTIEVKGGNHFQFYQPTIALTNPGKTAAGEWIDVIRFRDYLKDLIQTNMVQMMINRDKVPYTDQGLQLLGTNLRGSLRTGQQVGGIAPDEVAADGTARPGFNMTVPLLSEVDDVTKASRIAYLKFNARIAGAIHMVEITGALAYSLD